MVTSTIILNSVMEESRYTEEKLYACASVNMLKQFPIFILNVQQSETFSLLVNGFGYSLMDAKEKVLSMPLSNPDTDYMWAISNFDEHYGAATILYSDEIQRFANELEDDLYRPVLMNGSHIGNLISKLMKDTKISSARRTKH